MVQLRLTAPHGSCRVETASQRWPHLGAGGWSFYTHITVVAAGCLGKGLWCPGVSRPGRDTLEPSAVPTLGKQRPETYPPTSLTSSQHLSKASGPCLQAAVQMVCTLVHTHTRAYACTHWCTHTLVHTCALTRTHSCVHTLVRTHACTHMHIHTRVCTQSCTHVHARTCVKAQF